MKRYCICALLGWALFVPGAATAATVEAYRTLLSDNKILMEVYITTLAAALHFASKAKPRYCPPAGKTVSAKTVRSIIESVLKDNAGSGKLDPNTPIEAIVVNVLKRQSPCRE